MADHQAAMSYQRDEKHRYGEHYTPAAVARLLAAFAVRASGDKVFDPSCGDGRLLEESLRIKKSLASVRARFDLFGADRSPHAARLAAAAGAQIVCADFFDIEPGAQPGGLKFPPTFDALIGNPPYIRHEVMGREDKRKIEERLEADRLASPEIFWPRWSGRSDIYVYFFAHAARFLKANGRLVFLTASSWLDAGYGAALREFLLSNFRILAIIESAVESFFSDASVNTTITVLEREPDERARASNRVRFVQLLKPLDQIFSSVGDGACDFALAIENAQRSQKASTHRVRIARQSDLLGESMEGAMWGRHLRADDVFFEILDSGGERLRRLSDLARVRFGMKTGANEFFYVKGANSDDKKLLALSDVARVRRGLTTGANEFFYLKAVSSGGRDASCLTLVEDGLGAQHLVESRYLAPVLFSLKEISGFVIRRGETSKLFFHCADRRAEIAGTHALDYILSGESAGYDLRPTCAGRREWYAVARGMKPAPLIFPSKVGERWVVALNRARVFEDKKLYGIFPKEKSSTLALAALLNSTWARYYAEITCRQMTGAQAIADIDVRVAERILIPDPRSLPPQLKKNLEAAFEAIARREAFSIFEETGRDDRRLLDELTLEAIGLCSQERGPMLERLYAAMKELVRRRLALSH